MTALYLSLAFVLACGLASTLLIVLCAWQMLRDHARERIQAPELETCRECGTVAVRLDGTARCACGRLGFSEGFLRGIGVDPDAKYYAGSLR